MVETIKRHVPYSSALDVEIESQLLKEGYHLEGVSVTKEHILDIYSNVNGGKFILGKDNITGDLIAKNQS